MVNLRIHSLTTALLRVPILFAVVLGGCNEGRSDPDPAAPPPETVPSSVVIPASTAELGSPISRLRTTANISAYRITRFPITVHDYEACVTAGVCTPPALSTGACSEATIGKTNPETDDDSTVDRVPVMCTSIHQASTYCRWVGARLPTVAEHLLAARGTEIKRYAWGNEPPSCRQAWRVTFAPELPGTCCGSPCSDTSARIVGEHPAGKSPFGLEDVLSTRAELVLPAEKGVGACGSRDVGCYVTGMAPGAMDWFVGVRDGNEPPRFAAGFRCVWKEESR